MKLKFRHLLLVGSSLLAISTASAATLYWAGTGDWDTSSQVWGTSSSGPYTEAIWNNDNNDTAFFEGSAGDVTLTEPITVGGLTFATTGYFVTGNTLGFGVPGDIQTDAGVSATIESILAGSAAITKTGDGTLTLSGANTHSGTTTVTGGTLNLTGNRTAAVSDIDVTGEATLNISNGSFPIGDSNNFRVGAVTGAGTVNHTAGTISTGTGGNQVLIGRIQAGTYNLSGGTLNIGFTGPAGNRGVILGVNPGANGGGTFNLSGTGHLNMTEANSGLQIGRSDTASGETTNLFNQTGGTATIGYLRIGGNTGGAVDVESTLSLTGGVFTAAVFDRLAYGDTNTALIHIGGPADVTLPAFPAGALGTGSTATITFDGGLLRNSGTSTNYLGNISSARIMAGGARFNTGGGNITITHDLVEHDISTGGGLTKEGANTLTLSGNNTYTGATTVNGGTLVLSGVNASNGLILNGGTLTVGSNATSSGNDVLGAAGSTISVTANSTINYAPSGLTHTFDKAISIASGVTFTHVKGAAGSVTFSGVVSGGDNTRIDVNDAGSINQRPLIFSNAANTFTGTVDLSRNQSTVRFASIGDAADAGNIVFGIGTAGRNGSFQLDASAVAPMVLTHRRIEITAGASTAGIAQISNINTDPSVTLTINSDLLVTGTGGTKTLELRGANNGNNTFAGIIADGGLNALNLTKQDAGKWIISGASTYTGATTVNSGTLLVNSPGSLGSGTGSVTVNGGTLGGNGTINGSVTVAAAGNLAPGASVGTLNIGGNLDLSAMAGGAGIIHMELGPIASSDRIAAGTLDIGTGMLGFNDFNFTALAGLQDGIYKLITSGAAVTGSLDSGNLSGPIGVEGTGTLQISAGGTDIELVVGGIGAGGNPYDDWATGNEPFDGDASGDGVANGLAWFLGAATPATNALDKLPAPARDGSFLTLQFERVTPYAPAKLYVQFGNDLSGWTEAELPAASGTIPLPGDDIEVEVGPGSPAAVTVRIPVSYQSASGALFARLRATEN